MDGIGRKVGALLSLIVDAYWTVQVEESGAPKFSSRCLVDGIGRRVGALLSLVA